MGKGELSKGRILKVAQKLFIKHGYKSTGLNDIAAAISMTKGVLYHHFGGKDQLYRQSLEEIFTYPGPPLWMVWNDQSSFRQQLQWGFEEVDANVAWIKRKVGSRSDGAILQFYSFLYEATRRVPEFQSRIDRYDQQKHRALTQSITRGQETGELRQDINPMATAIELDALLQQLVYQRFVNHQVRNDDDLLQIMFKNYWLRLKG